MCRLTILSMFPAVGCTSDLQRLCSVRKLRLSALLSAAGELKVSPFACCAKVAIGTLFFRTTGVAPADNKTTTPITFHISIVPHMSAPGVKLGTRPNWPNKPFMHSCKLLSITSDILLQNVCNCATLNDYMIRAVN